MQLAHTYRTIALTLAIVFAVFNIGLPIVIASCPMMKYSDSKQCMMCDDGATPGRARISNFVDKSCCETKFASERNRTEFLQLRIDQLDLSKQLVAVVSPLICGNVVPDFSFLIDNSASPPRAINIPILISSLVI